ncbi:MAG: hypothetical protein IIY89_01075 [Clostridia bacterium]|nr:hypothetical protein [Clostridia bacterium]
MRYILITLGWLALMWAALSVARIVLRPGGRGRGAFVVLPVAGHVEDVELRVRRLVRGVRSLRGAVILLTDFGADAETADICRRLCREFGNVEMIDGREMVKRVKP